MTPRIQAMMKVLIRARLEDREWYTELLNRISYKDSYLLVEAGFRLGG